MIYGQWWSSYEKEGIILSVIAFIICPDGSIGGQKKNPTEEDIEKLKTYAIAAGKDYRVGWFDGTGIAVWEQLKEERVVVGEEV